MPNQGLSDEDAIAAIEAVARYGSQSEAARMLKLSRSTLQNRLMVARARGITSDHVPRPEAVVSPEDRHDAKFWREKAQKQQLELDELHARVREFGVLDGMKIGQLDFAPIDRAKKRGSATLIVHNSDRHYGEVIDAAEINNWNSYNPEICERRVQRFMDAACILGRRWTSDVDVDGVLYTMGGDEISGDIHDELTATNALTSLDSVAGAVALHSACLRQLVDEYDRVHVVAVPGNHGRTTRKPQAKKIGSQSYDIHIAKLVAREMQSDDRISFDIAAGPDVMTMIYGRPILTTHGERMGTGGGKGFSGPVLPIIRGATQVKLQYGAQDLRPDLILMGHYHTSAAPPGILANGSVAGYSEFGFGIRASYDVPRQWLAVIRSRWGLCERLDVQLEEPRIAEKPRVRIGAAQK